MALPAEFSRRQSLAETLPGRIALLTTSNLGEISGRNEERAVRGLPIEVVRFDATNPQELARLEDSFRHPTRRMGTEQWRTGIVAVGDVAAAMALRYKGVDETGNVDRLVVIGAPKVGELAVPPLVAADTMVLIPSRTREAGYNPEGRKLAGAVNVVYDVVGARNLDGAPGLPRVVEPSEEVQEGLKTGNGNDNFLRIVRHLSHL